MPATAEEGRRLKELMNKAVAALSQDEKNELRDLIARNPEMPLTRIIDDPDLPDPE